MLRWQAQHQKQTSFRHLHLLLVQYLLRANSKTTIQLLCDCKTEKLMLDKNQNFNVIISYH